jgi:Holliday junction resolvasome RuvABC endonuclease subunit
METPRVVGLDLSMTCTGIALPNGATTLVKTTQNDGDYRLVAIRDAVRIALGDAPDGTGWPTNPTPALVVIEDLPTHAKSAGITGMVHGAVRTLLQERTVPYALVAPATLKAFATGTGSGDKTAMAMAAYKRAGAEFENDKGGDQCDAWWLRAAGLQYLGHPVVELPAPQVARLDKVTWPELAVA